MARGLQECLILQLKEKNRFAMGTCFWLVGTQYPHSFFKKVITCFQNIRHFIAYMVNTASRIFLQIIGNWRVITKWIK